jgi:alcohol dehydrogenase
MKAVVLHAHGGPEQLVYEAHFPDPQAGPGDVVLRVKASSLNYHDVFTRRGMPGIALKFPVIIGLDLAGEIVELGPGVSGWRVGDRVLVDPVNRVHGGLMGETMHGGLAEYCRVAAHQLLRLPEAVSYVEAAALPVAYGTAHRMMLTQGRITAGEKIFILGASGGVGTCCLFLAKMVGAEVVVGGSNDAKLQKLRALGADHAVNYATHDFVREIHARYGKPHRRGGTGGVDVVVNYTGGETSQVLAPWWPDVNLWRHGRVRSADRHPVYLDVRAAYYWRQWLGAPGPRNPPHACPGRQNAPGD